MVSDLSDAGIKREELQNIAEYKFYNFKLDEEKYWREIKGESSFAATTNGVLSASARASIDQEEKNTDISSKQGLKSFKKLVPPLKILIIGDSFIESVFGPQLERDLLAFDGISTVRFGKIATGFNRNSEIFNWTQNIKSLISQHDPDIILISLGANDVNPMLGLTFYQQEWRDIYADRVEEFANTIPDDIRIYWIGHTISTNSIWNEGIVVIIDIFKKEIDEHENQSFIDVWDRFTKDGAYASFIENDDGIMIKVKDADGIHFTQAGADILSHLVIENMKEDINFNP
jgi:hypothetical protein